MRAARVDTGGARSRHRRQPGHNKADAARPVPTTNGHRHRSDVDIAVTLDRGDRPRHAHRAAGRGPGGRPVASAWTQQVSP